MDPELLAYLKTLTTHAEVAGLIAFTTWCLSRGWVDKQILVGLLLASAGGLGLKMAGV